MIFIFSSFDIDFLASPAPRQPSSTPDSPDAFVFHIKVVLNNILVDGVALEKFS